MRLYFILLLLCAPLVSLAEDVAAKVIKVLGEVTAMNVNNEIRKLERGSDVNSKDTVITSVDGAATLRFTDGTVIDVAAASKYVIHDYAFNQAEPKKDKFSSEVVAGGFRAITGTIGMRSPSEFTAKANLTTLSIRGTLFYLICSNGCNDVTQFTIEGETALNYNGKEYLLGPTAPQSTFSLAQGKVNLSREIPAHLPVKYDGDVAKFKALQASTETVSKAKPGGAEGEDPCKVLNNVGNAVK